MLSSVNFSFIYFRHLSSLQLLFFFLLICINSELVPCWLYNILICFFCVPFIFSESFLSLYKVDFIISFYLALESLRNFSIVSLKILILKHFDSFNNYLLFHLEHILIVREGSCSPPTNGCSVITSVFIELFPNRLAGHLF